MAGLRDRQSAPEPLGGIADVDEVAYLVIRWHQRRPTERHELGGGHVVDPLLGQPLAHAGAPQTTMSHRACDAKADDLHTPAVERLGQLLAPGLAAGVGTVRIDRGVLVERSVAGPAVDGDRAGVDDALDAVDPRGLEHVGGAETLHPDVRNGLTRRDLPTGEV